MNEARSLILDTHVWLWTMLGSRDEMSNAAVEEIEAHTAAGSLLIAAISVWEVAMLESRGRIQFFSANF